MEERGRGSISQRGLRLSLQPAAAGSGAPLLSGELFAWVRTQDTTKTPFPGGAGPPTRGDLRAQGSQSPRHLRVEAGATRERGLL